MTHKDKGPLSEPNVLLCSPSSCYGNIFNIHKLSSEFLSYVLCQSDIIHFYFHILH